VESPKRSISSRPMMILEAVDCRRSWTSSAREPVMFTGSSCSDFGAASSGAAGAAGAGRGAGTGAGAGDGAGTEPGAGAGTGGSPGDPL
jgi:hypothetical protein